MLKKMKYILTAQHTHCTIHRTCDSFIF